MTQSMYAICVHSPEHVLLVGEYTGVRRLRTAMLRRTLGGWRGFVRARKQGHMRHVHHVRYDAALVARMDRDELGRDMLVVGRYAIEDLVFRHQPDTLEALRRLLAGVFMYRDDATEALRDLVAAGVVQVEQAPSEV